MQHILMIEDDARLAAMVSDYLGQNGFDVAPAPDAQSGLARLQTAGVDLVILDLMLPDMDGLQVCQRIRALPGALGQVPVLMLTAKGDPMDRIIGLEMACVYEALGSEVSVVELGDGLIPGADRDLVKVLETRLRKRYAAILLGTKVSTKTCFSNNIFAQR